MRFSNISNKLRTMSTFTPERDDVLTSAHLMEALSLKRISERPRLITSDDEAIELSPELAKIFKSIALDFAAGKAVTVISHETQLTTQQAADFLRVSRPTFIKMLSDYNVPFETVGRHRRIQFAHVTDLKTKVKNNQASLLRAMANENQTSKMLDETSARNPLIRA